MNSEASWGVNTAMIKQVRRGAVLEKHICSLYIAISICHVPPDFPSKAYELARFVFPPMNTRTLQLESQF